MKNIILAAIACCAVSVLSAAAPRTDVVIETTDGILLHAEYVSENDKVGVIDVRAALMPAGMCDEKSFPKYIPKGKLKNPTKMSSGHCLFTGKPFVMRSMPIAAAEIKKRYDTALLTLSGNSEKKQGPFYGTTGNYAWGFNVTAEPVAGGGLAPAVGLQSFPMDKSMDTIQTIDLDGKRTTLYPSQSVWNKYKSLDPRVGATYNPLMPIGAIGALNFSAVGFNLYTSVAIPDMKFLPLKKHSMRLRGGLVAGFHSISGDQTQNGESVATASITLIPVLAQLAYYWDLKPKGTKFTVSPSFKLGVGVIFSSISTALKGQYIAQLATPTSEASRSGSYLGLAIQPGLGVEIKHGSMPNIAYFLDVAYLQHFETTSGSFLSFQIGGAYHFGGKVPEAKMLPITYLGNKSVVLTLKGTVKEPDGDVLAGAVVTLTAKGSTAVVKQATANDKGQYSIDLEPGLDYTVEATKDAYVKSTLELPMLSNDKKTREHDFIMAPLKYSLEGVNFKPDSDQLLTGKAPEKALNELVKFLQSNSGLKIEIGGHTAASGTDDASSRALSKKRAESVRKFIIAKGIDGSRLTSEGYGGSAPIADGKTAAGAAKNRRVEVQILIE